MNMKEIKNMKKLSILFISSLIGTAGLMTSCSEDYPGPDPVDVTANYSNKYLSKSNLTLTYDGDEMTGKAVDFSTVKGETANVTFYNVLPCVNCFDEGGVGGYKKGCLYSKTVKASFFY